MHFEKITLAVMQKTGQGGQVKSVCAKSSWEAVMIFQGELMIAWPRGSKEIRNEYIQEICKELNWTGLVDALDREVKKRKVLGYL